MRQRNTLTGLRALATALQMQYPYARKPWFTQNKQRTIHSEDILELKLYMSGQCWVYCSQKAFHRKAPSIMHKHYNNDTKRKSVAGAFITPSIQLEAKLCKYGVSALSQLGKLAILLSKQSNYNAFLSVTTEYLFLYTQIYLTCPV